MTKTAVTNINWFQTLNFISGNYFFYFVINNTNSGSPFNILIDTQIYFITTCLRMYVRLRENIKNIFF